MAIPNHHYKNEKHDIIILLIITGSDDIAHVCRTPCYIARRLEINANTLIVVYASINLKSGNCEHEITIVRWLKLHFKAL